MTVFFTVLSGVLVFVLGQIIVKFFVETILKQYKCIGKIIYALVFYANLYTNPIAKDDPRLSPELKEEREKAADYIRQLASELNAKNQQIRWYKIFERLKIVPHRNSIVEASKSLIGISHCFFASSRENIKSASEDAKAYRDDIKNRLGIDFLKE